MKSAEEIKNLITPERYMQMVSVWGNRVDAINEVLDDWGVEDIKKGYCVFNYDGTGMMEVCRIDAVGAFEDDEDAVAQAQRDGMAFIPIDELPDNFDRRYLGWIDTEENRRVISEYCKNL